MSFLLSFLIWEVVNLNESINICTIYILHKVFIFIKLIQKGSFSLLHAIVCILDDLKYVHALRWDLHSCLAFTLTKLLIMLSTKNSMHLYQLSKSIFYISLSACSHLFILSWFDWIFSDKIFIKLQNTSLGYREKK